MYKRNLLLILAIVILSISLNAADSVDSVKNVFYSSFEDDMPSQTGSLLKVNTVDMDSGNNKRISGISNNLGNGEMLFWLSDIIGNPSYVPYENIYNLIDGDPNTKYLTLEKLPLIIRYILIDNKIITSYSVTSANDFQYRDPQDWTLEASVNNKKWIVLDTVRNEVFNNRLEKKIYSIKNTKAYKYYRLNITKKSNNKDADVANESLVQLADFELYSDTAVKTENSRDYMVSINSYGPKNVWCNFAGQGWKGKKALLITGIHNGEGRAYSYNVIYDNLKIPVKDDTYLSYVIFPDFIGNYNFERPSHYVALDIKFTDGTYLSELKARDTYNFILSPQNHGEDKKLISRQWNYIKVNIGNVAKGKTISKILAAYDKPNNKSKAPLVFCDYIDEVKITEEIIKKSDSPVDYAVTTRGTNDSIVYSRGLCFPGISVPNGFNFWTPSTTNGSRKIYDYQSGNKITHFMTSHQASFHLADHGNFMFMPNISVNIKNATSNNLDSSSRACSFDHSDETAKPYYYSVVLDKYSPAGNTKVEMAPTDHAAAVRFTFPGDAKNKNIVFDCISDYMRHNGRILFNSDGSFTAYINNMSGMTSGTPGLYIYGKFSVAPESVRLLSNERPFSVVSFSSDTKTVILNIATSYMSNEQAKKNLEMEIGHYSFDIVKEQGRTAWNNIFNKIEIDGATKEELVSFYSSMYRLYAYLTNLNENIGTKENPVIAYASPYKSKPENPVVVRGEMFTSNGFWDTYRTAWSAYALLTPKLDSRLLNGIAEHYKESGWLAKWLNPKGIDCMVGTNSDVIFADAYLKGIDFNLELAYESAIKNATVNAPGGVGRAESNTASYEGFVRNFSWTVENSIDDAGISVMSGALGNRDEEKYFKARALSYSKMFNKDMGWFMGRDFNGNWEGTEKSFDPYFWHGHYVETNAWGMCVSAPHDGQGLVNLYGGWDKLAEKIDSIFAAEEDYHYPHPQHEMYEARELRMGQYQHSNQQAHHILYMYNYARQPYKTQEKVREVVNRLYMGSEIGQGYCGDEDNGEASAWYIFSSMGFYPLSLASGSYAIGSPLFNKVVLHLDSGDVVIEAKNNSKDNMYIQSMALDGKEYNKSYITHKDLINSKHIVFVMGNKPSDWATEKDSVPVSFVTKTDIMPVGIVDYTAKNTLVTNKFDLNRPASAFSENAVDLSKLFDNNSDTYTKLPKKCVYYTFDRPVILNFCSITSADNLNLAPNGFEIYGSLNGSDNSWIKIEKRSDINYKWGKSLKPFIFDNTKEYRFYRLNLYNNTDAVELSELELGRCDI